MEFQEFIRQKNRMCSYYNNMCGDCPMTEYRYIEYCPSFIMKNPDIAEQVVTEWAAANPVKTNREKFKEVFGTELHTIPNHYRWGTIRDVSSVGIWLDEEYIEPKGD